MPGKQKAHMIIRLMVAGHICVANMKDIILMKMTIDQIRSSETRKNNRNS